MTRVLVGLTVGVTLAGGVGLSRVAVGARGETAVVTTSVAEGGVKREDNANAAKRARNTKPVTPKKITGK